MRQFISKYTYSFISSKGIYLVYNSRINTFMEVSSSIYSFLEEFKGIPLSNNSLLIPEEIDVLSKYKIIVNEGEDEDYWLQQKYVENQLHYSKEDLNLTIAPTTACNFNCPYCYELQKRPIKMTDETINALFDFINMHENAKRLNIIWYGGEPLMAFDIIKKILIQIKEKINIPLASQGIVTNGYCFNQKVIDFFKDYPLDDIQITLDGIKEHHDQKRRLKANNSGTYERILDNIYLITDGLPNTNINIRVNIDKNNIEDFHMVLEMLREKFPNKNVYAYPGKIEIENQEQTCLICDSLLNENAKTLYYDLKQKFNESVNFFPRIKRKGCGATSLYSYVIGPLGEYYKCWKNMGDKDKIIGFINQTYLKDPFLLHKYMVSGNCMEDNKCKECSFLPICDGGCPDYRMKNIHHNGNFDLCSIYKLPNVLNECLEMHYESLQNRINNE